MITACFRDSLGENTIDLLNAIPLLLTNILQLDNPEHLSHFETGNAQCQFVLNTGLLIFAPKTLHKT